MKVSEFNIIYEPSVQYSEKVVSSESVNEIVRPFFGNNINYKECFYLVCLKRNNEVCHVNKISEGGTSATIVDVKCLMQSALLSNASSIVCVHNHPSGNSNPSKQDITITKKIKDACNLLDISLLDHLILTPDSYYSFADEGML